MDPIRHKLGSLDLAVVSDGLFYYDAGATFGIVPRVMWEPYAGPLDDRYRLAMGLNSVVVRSSGKLVLIETGVGDKPGGARRQSSAVSEGTLLTGLAALGLQPEDFDVVINTHLHFDHCGWNTRFVDGVLEPTFPNAEYLVMKGEWEVATHPNERTRATYLEENLAPLAEGGRLRLIDGEYHVTDEITLLPTPGHTADHASVVIASAGEIAIYVGDIAQVAVQLERTAWVSSFDVLPLVSMETKRALVEKAIAQESLLIGSHLPFPGLGHMRRDADSRRRWLPLDHL